MVAVIDKVSRHAWFKSAIGPAGFASLVSIGLFAGFMVTVLVLELSMRSADGVVYTHIRQIELIGLDVLAGLTLLPAMAATIVVVISRLPLRGATRWLPVVALLLMVGVLSISAIVNLPINADQRMWVAASPPVDWEAVRDQWQLAHVVRTVLAVAAFGGLGLTTIDLRRLR
ncbi:DUF1772 domain-containing protein [Nocardia wallacei]|uniref:DUF1772 domain-containing protein n=1 Tax=Nocardia wallacei TaxID=480035 RepID=UPI002458DA8A|nr:DUF1772 domain-containing protein [Nocardia wallacei]